MSWLVRSSILRVTLVSTMTLSSACGPNGCIDDGWLEILSALTGTSRERATEPVTVRGLRVLAVQVDPPGLLFDPRLLTPSTRALVDPITVNVAADAVWPTGGEAEVSVLLCASVIPKDVAFVVPWDFDFTRLNNVPPTQEEIISECLDRSVDSDLADDVREAHSPKTLSVRFAATDLDPFGPAVPGISASFQLSPDALASFAQDLGGDLYTFNGGALHVIVDVRPPAPGIRTSAAVALPMRLNVHSPDLSDETRLRLIATVGDPPACEPGLIERCRPTSEPPCGSSVLEPTPDPLDENFCANPHMLYFNCQGSYRSANCSIEFPCGIDCQVAADECLGLFDCLLPFTPNSALVPIGFSAFDEQDGIFIDRLLAYDAPTSTLHAPADQTLFFGPRFNYNELEYFQTRVPDYKFSRAPPLNENPPPDENGNARSGNGTLAFPHLSTTLENPCLRAFVLEGGGSVRDRSGNEMTVFTCLNDGTNTVLEFIAPTQRSAGEKDHIRLAISDGRGAWTFQLLTIAWE